MRWDKKYKDVCSGRSGNTPGKVTNGAWNRPGPDLDCADIPTKFKPVRITGPDYHRLDRDGDGWGCD